MFNDSVKYRRACIHVQIHQSYNCQWNNYNGWNLCDQIPKEKQDMIFEKFFRLDSSRGSSTGGAGLGLAIAKEIAELHGGSICLNSTPEYTDFIVTLPKVKK